MLSMKVDARAGLRWIDALSDQLPFAVASALTATAKEVSAELSAEVERVFEGGAVAFTERAFRVQPARKDRWQAAVVVLPKQAEYLRWQIVGGERQPKRKALRLPTEVQLTGEGNLPNGLIRQLVARARSGKRATRTQSARFGVSQQVSLFYGEPGDGRPAGVYKRVPLGSQREALVPVVVFPQQPAKYEPRFDFYGVARRVVDQRWQANLQRAWQRAMATARR